MSYIAPNSTIRLYANVPLDNSYTNTIWFTSKAEQDAYFHGSADVITTLSNQYYQRATRNSLKVQVPIGSCYRCNYLAFRNDSFENKWFYAFVTDVEYVNNEVTEIFYELDVMQTYRFDVFFNACYVEREHCTKGEDVIGNFILPEPVSVGEYLYSDYKDISNIGDCYIIVAIADVDYDASGVIGSYSGTISGKIINGVYNGCTLYAFTTTTDTSTGIGALENLLRSYIMKPKAIVDMFMCPKFCVGVSDNVVQSGLTVKDISDSRVGGTFGNYTPRNNKLYTYPYNAYQVSTPDGNTKLYRYEFFNDNTPRFRIRGSISQPVTVNLRPRQYKNLTDQSTAQEYGIRELGLSITEYPKCSWVYDAYSAYASRNYQNLLIQSGASIANLAGVNMSWARRRDSSGKFVGGKDKLGRPIEGWTNTWTGKLAYNKDQAIKTANNKALQDFGGDVIDTLGNFYWAKREADVVSGSLLNGTPDFAEGYEFFGSRVYIPEENARAIDNFFSLYGYQTNRIKVPNFNSRPVFNYVKIVGECCEPADNSMVNASDIDDMNTILNNGITFWHTTDHYTVGNYTSGTLDNNNA